MNPQSKYMLFYSNNCIHSREFINQLYKNQPVYNAFIKIDVQNTKVNIPKCVKAVPTIIIKSVNASPQVFTGDEVFKWYNQLLSRLQQASAAPTQQGPSSNLGNGTAKSLGSILDYDPCTMSGFSDNFAYVEDKTIQSNPIEHQFEFVGRSMAPASMQMSGQGQGGPQVGKSKDEDKNALAGAYEQMMAQRAMDVPQPPERKSGIDS